MYYCDKFKESFSDYIEGELSADARQVIESHLSVCPGCREVIYRMNSIRRSLNQLPRLNTSPDFEIKLNQRLHHLSNQRTFPFPLNYFQNWKVPAISFAVVLMVFSFFMFYDNGPVETNVSAPTQSGIKATFPGEDEQRGTINDTSNHPETTPGMATTTTDSTKQDSHKNLNINQGNIKPVNKKTVEK